MRPFLGSIFSIKNFLTWEFTSADPVRSVLPLELIYNMPMSMLHWVWAEFREDQVPMKVVYNAMRVMFFMGSFILEDWAIHDLIPSPKDRRLAVILVSSSYVTWTYQTHTFSNSIETLVTLSALLLIQMILDHKVRLGSLLLSTTCTDIYSGSDVSSKVGGSWRLDSVRCFQSHYCTSIPLRARVVSHPAFHSQVRTPKYQYLFVQFSNIPVDLYHSLAYFLALYSFQPSPL